MAPGQDSTAFGLFATHRGALIDYANGIVGDRAQAEDLVQEAFLRFATAKDKPQVERPAAYLYRIVRNLAIDWVRQRAREQRRQAEEPAWWMLPDVARTPEQELLHRQDLARIAAVLAELSPEARLAVEMHRFGGYTLSEIAARLNVSVPTVHRLVRDALVKIAVRLGAQSEE
ncbi:MAG: sigma-70 family RNA polymerase sigma factor [Kiloniellales bacterium]|nr:sigma-70 family RNA polymerase sigma factor [Kiloniellales bacterium]